MPANHAVGTTAPLDPARDRMRTGPGQSLSEEVVMAMPIWPGLDMGSQVEEMRHRSKRATESMVSVVAAREMLKRVARGLSWEPPDAATNSGGPSRPGPAATGPAGADRKAPAAPRRG